MSEKTIDEDAVKNSALILAGVLGFVIAALLSLSFYALSSRFGGAPAASSIFLAGAISLKVAQRFFNRWMKRRIVRSENSAGVIEATARTMEAEAIFGIIKRYEKETALEEIEKRIHQLKVEANEAMAGKENVCPDCGEIHF